MIISKNCDQDLDAPQTSFAVPWRTFTQRSVLLWKFLGIWWIHVSFIVTKRRIHHVDSLEDVKPYPPYVFSFCDCTRLFLYCSTWIFGVTGASTIDQFNNSFNNFTFLFQLLHWDFAPLPWATFKEFISLEILIKWSIHYTC